MWFKGLIYHFNQAIISYQRPNISLTYSTDLSNEESLIKKLLLFLLELLLQLESVREFKSSPDKEQTRLLESEL